MFCWNEACCIILLWLKPMLPSFLHLSLCLPNWVAPRCSPQHLLSSFPLFGGHHAILSLPSSCSVLLLHLMQLMPASISTILFLGFWSGGAEETHLVIHCLELLCHCFRVGGTLTLHHGV